MGTGFRRVSFFVYKRTEGYYMGLSTGADFWYYLERRTNCGIFSFENNLQDPMSRIRRLSDPITIHCSPRDPTAALTPSAARLPVRFEIF